MTKTQLLKQYKCNIKTSGKLAANKFGVKLYLFLQFINRIFAYCKGGNYNIHTWAWFGYFI